MAQTNILDTIIAHKRAELPALMAAHPPSALERRPFFGRECLPLAERIRAGASTGVIAEFKRRSPSKGLINGEARVEAVAAAYAEAGAAAVSVLTDAPFFGGGAEDLEAARLAVGIPLLRKDFIVDEYQLLEAKAMGADVVLLIAACLQPAEVRALARAARGLGLQTLLELHDEAETGHVCPEVDMVGVNNRDLRTFAVDMDRSLRMAELLGPEKVRVAESGIRDARQLKAFRDGGFEAFLIGERFMKTPDPGAAFRDFIAEL